MSWSFVQAARGVTPSGGNPVCDGASAAPLAATTAGNLLLGFLGGVAFGSIASGASMPSGWIDCGSGFKSNSNVIGQLFAYPSNPGGITSVTGTFSGAGVGNTSGFLQIFEFLGTGTIEDFGFSIGTPPAPSAVAARSGDLAFAAFVTAGTAPYGTDSGWTQNQVTNGGWGGHFMGEYELAAAGGTVTANPGSAGSSCLGFVVLIPLFSPNADAASGRASAVAHARAPAVRIDRSVAAPVKTATATAHAPSVVIGIDASPTVPSLSASATAIGASVTITRGVILAPTLSGERVGQPLLLRTRTIAPPSIASGAQTGSPTLSRAALLASVASGEGIGSPTVSGGASGILAPSVASSELVGEPTLRRRVLLTGLINNGYVAKNQRSPFAPANVVGRPHLIPAYRVVVIPAIPSEEQIGDPFLFDHRLLTNPPGPSSYTQELAPTEEDPT